MTQIAEPLVQVLEATGYLSDGLPTASSVVVGDEMSGTAVPSFSPDAWWRSNPDTGPWRGDVDLRVYFKFVEDPENEPLHEWQQELWNQGFSPLLWVVSPSKIDLYNGFGTPQDAADANRLRTFTQLDAHLSELDSYAGRLAMETGQFWRSEPAVNRKNSVDKRLLRDLAALERKLVENSLDREDAQALIGRSIFVQYLIDRGIVPKERLLALTGEESLSAVLNNHDAARRLFDWLRETFNGDMFPPCVALVPEVQHIQSVADFLEGTDPDTGQASLFPYRFDVIPVELISAIYEQFVHASESSTSTSDVHYTPITAVSLVLDEIFEGLTGHETVLDLTCGSGIFLVEAMRRLVRLRSNGEKPRRETVRDVLHNQIHGLDIMPQAVRIAAFSLYLAALELDPSPDDLKFEPLIGTSLREGDAFVEDFDQKRFDVIVGNPPWSFRGKEATAARRTRSSTVLRQPRGESLDFAERASDFTHSSTRVGMILSATPFFSRSAKSLDTVQRVVQKLAPVTLVNLSELSGWLFPNANMPAMALIASRSGRSPKDMVLVQARWSETGEHTHMIEVAPRDVTTLPVSSWKRNAGLLKASFLGCRHDLVLLDELRDKFRPLEESLKAMCTELRTGVILGSGGKSAEFLAGMPYAKSGLRHFQLPADLPAFRQSFAERPRQKAFFEGPILVVGEFLQARSPRPIAVVSKGDLIFSDAYFGASFTHCRDESAYLVAGILGSALASWYFLMTGSSFGIWIRRLKKSDIATLPVPDFRRAAESTSGKQVVRLVQTLHDERPIQASWHRLDDAVFELYGLDNEQRAVVRDGLSRSSWQWRAGRLESVRPASRHDLAQYAKTFLDTMDAWLSGAGSKRMRAEILEFPSNDPLRIIRFILEEVHGPSEQIDIVSPEGALSGVLSRIGQRAKVQVSSALVGVRDLRVHTQDEVTIIKPAARRNWLSVHALEDADAVVEDSLRGIDQG